MQTSSPKESSSPEKNIISPLLSLLLIHTPPPKEPSLLPPSSYGTLLSPFLSPFPICSSEIQRRTSRTEHFFLTNFERITKSLSPFFVHKPSRRRKRPVKFLVKKSLETKRLLLKNRNYSLTDILSSFLSPFLIQSETTHSPVPLRRTKGRDISYVIQQELVGFSSIKREYKWSDEKMDEFFLSLLGGEKMAQEIKFERIEPVIKELIEQTGEDRCTQTFEVIVNLQGYTKGDKKIRGEVVLPHSKRKEEKVLILGESALLDVAKKHQLPYVSATEYKSPEEEKDKEKEKAMEKKRKKLISNFHSFIALSTFPKKNYIKYAMFVKKRKPLYTVKEDDVEKLKRIYEETKRKISFMAKPESLLIQFPVGYSEMSVREVTENIVYALSYLLTILKSGIQNVKTIFVKTTQGKSLRIY